MKKIIIIILFLLLSLSANALDWKEVDWTKIDGVGGVSPSDICIAGNEYLYFDCSTNTKGIRWNTALTAFQFPAPLTFFDGVGSPSELSFLGATNSDEIFVGMEESAIAGESDLYIQLAGSNGEFQVRNSIGSSVAYITDSGAIVSVKNFLGDSYQIYDLDSSHFLEMITTEDLIANKELDIIVGGADRSITFEGDTIISQDYSTDSTTVTFGGINLDGDVDIDFDEATEEFNSSSIFSTDGAGAVVYTPHTFYTRISAGTFGDSLTGSIIDINQNNNLTAFAADNYQALRIWKGSGSAPTPTYADYGDVLIEAFTETEQLAITNNTAAYSVGDIGAPLNFYSDSMDITDTGLARTEGSANANQFLAPSYIGTNAVTATNAATVFINGAPIAGANFTITNPYALHVTGGEILLDGKYGNAGGYVSAAGAGTFTQVSSGNIYNTGLVRSGYYLAISNASIPTGANYLSIGRNAMILEGPTSDNFELNMNFPTIDPDSDIDVTIQAAKLLTAGADTTVSGLPLSLSSEIYHITHDDFAVAATTDDIIIAILPARTLLAYALLVVTEQGVFSDTLEITLGSAGATYDQIIGGGVAGALDGKAAVDTKWGDGDTERSTDLPDADVYGAKLYSWTSTQDITLHVDGNATNLDQATAGEYDILLVWQTFPTVGE